MGTETGMAVWWRDDTDAYMAVRSDPQAGTVRQCDANNERPRQALGFLTSRQPFQRLMLGLPVASTV